MEDLKEIYERLKVKSITIQSEYDISKKDLAEVISDIKRSEKEKEDSIKDIGTLQQVSEIIRGCITKLSEGHIAHLRELINSMLSMVFFDRAYSIDMVVGDTKAGKTLNLFLLDSADPDDVVTTELSSNGGGLQSIIGFVLQVYFIIYFNQRSVLFLDEALSAVSDEYLPNLMEFIEGLVKKYEFTFVMVVHDTRFIDYGTRIYRVSNGRAQLIKN